MIININNNGYVLCRSNFYSANDLLSDTDFIFTSGVNKLVGEIDSGIWCISYLLSMHRYKSKDFVLFKEPMVTVNDTIIPLDEFATYTCYLDTLYPLFSKKTSVDRLVAKGIRSNKLDISLDNIRELFCIDKQRFTRPLSGVGNEIFKAMAAIGYVNDKKVFCFPWLSYSRYNNYHKQIDGLTKILADLDKVVVLPLGRK